jgi:hypothetical protein
MIIISARAVLIDDNIVKVLYDQMAGLMRVGDKLYEYGTFPEVKSYIGKLRNVNFTSSAYFGNTCCFTAFNGDVLVARNVTQWPLGRQGSTANTRYLKPNCTLLDFLALAETACQYSDLTGLYGLHQILKELPIVN